MKKFFLLSVLMLGALAASAQVYLGGTVGYNRDIDDNETEFSILPEIGYSFNDNWAVGLTFGYDYQYNFNDMREKLNLGVVSPYARWTFWNSDNNMVGLFVDGGVDMEFGKAKVDGYKSKTAFVYGIGLKPGIVLRPTEKFSILAHVGFFGYRGCNNAAKDAGVSRVVGLGLSSLDLNLGFYYNF